ncbi:MAG: TMEM43 family protein [Bdellovibrionota bacterium]|jgi:hypothetical protein
MAYTKTTTKSYSSRLGDSLKGILFGIILFIGGTVLLFYNEGRAVKTEAAISEAQENVVEATDISNIDPALNGKLIHASGRAETKDILTDPTFNIQTTAIKLRRTLYYYQWEEESRSETRENAGGSMETTTTYTYKKVWSGTPIDSTQFENPKYRDRNFQLLNLKSEEWLAPHVTFGAYTLPTFLKNAILGEDPVAVSMTDQQRHDWQTRLAKSFTARQRPDASSEKEDAPQNEVPTLLHITDNTIYFGKSDVDPQIGDMKVIFTKVVPAQVSILANVSGTTFEKYRAQNGETFSRLEMDTVSAEVMFKNAHRENMILTWVLRAVGTLLIVIGLRVAFSIVSMIFKWFPLLGNIIEAGVGIVCFVGGIIWSLLVIASAWIIYRPVLAITLIGIAIAALIWLALRGKKASA